jgi:hypothetical protein
MSGGGGGAGGGAYMHLLEELTAACLMLDESIETIHKFLFLVLSVRSSKTKARG